MELGPGGGLDRGTQLVCYWGHRPEPRYPDFQANGPIHPAEQCGLASNSTALTSYADTSRNADVSFGKMILFSCPQALW